jgi:HEAT repeat protein/cyclophilin family peptidyl-prolyl cis-trans isomerase
VSRARSSIRAAVVAGGTLAAAACATAPPVRAPVVPVELKLSWIVRLEDRRVLREEPPPAPVAPPPITGRRQPRKSTLPPAPPVPDLRQLVQDAEPRVRYRAALAIGRVGLADGIAALTATLADAAPEVRQIAAFALGLIGDRAAGATLTKALADPDWMVRGRAAEALGLIGDASAAAAIGALAKEAASTGHVTAIAPDADADETAGGPQLDAAAGAFRLAICALARLGAFEPLAAATIGPDGEPIGRWWPIAYALQRALDANDSARSDPRAGQALLALVRGPGRDTIAFAARGLGLARPAGAAEALIPLVQPASLDPRVAVSAVRALAQTGGDAAAAALVTLVRTPAIDPNVRLEAVTALGTLRAPAAREALIDQIADPWPSMRAAALRALAAIDVDEFLLIFSGLDPDPHWSVRAAVAAALAELPAEPAVARLESMIADTDRRVVPAVLTALARLEAPSVAATLLEHLKDPDVVVRMTAARLLGERKEAQHFDALAGAYRAWSGDPTYLARAAALASAVAVDGARAAGILREALADREWAVRVRAAELLRGLDPAAAAAERIRPVPNAAPPVPYDSPELIAPPFSPHLYLETAKGTIEIELAVQDAPITAQVLIALARRQFFSGIPVHRVVPNFVVQGGDPRGDGEGGPGFTIRDELTPRPYRRGTVGIALDWEDTGGSQFFVTHSPQPHLDARYTVIGHVVAGMEVVDRLQQWDVIQRVRVWDGVKLTP